MKLYELSLLSSLCLSCGQSQIIGLYPLDGLSHVRVGGGLEVPVTTSVNLLLVGLNLPPTGGRLFFTTGNSSCSLVRSTDIFPLVKVEGHPTSAQVTVRFEIREHPDESWFMCLILPTNRGNATPIAMGNTTHPRAFNASRPQVVHQGTADWLQVHVVPISTENELLLPLWVQISICLVLLLLSGLFSGLNLGLMSLDTTELQIIEKVGSDSEKRHARRIGPLRRRGNLLLCSLLLGNVMVNSTFTILFDNMTNGLVAVICSTVGIVIFGEIIPQAICSRHGLAVGAKTYPITLFFIVVTFPAAYPISVVLDYLLGAEMGQIYNKEKLQELIRLNADQHVILDNEANIISGALQLTNKRVADIMTNIEDVYMLEINTVLDFETLTDILHQGYTRIPVYEGHMGNIINLLNTKELALIDPEDKTLLSTVCKFYDHKPLFVDHNVRLDVMLQTFLQAGSSHMAIVQKHSKSRDDREVVESLGLVTLEDVIEEILQSEIVDETDLKSDNRQKTPFRKKEDYGALVPDGCKSTLPKQLAFAAFQFLTTTVEPFSDAHMARNVLKTLMRKNIVVTLIPSGYDTVKNFIYRKGVPTDIFVLILQGTVEVEIGDARMVFESGPFSYFGVEVFNAVNLAAPSTDKPDYVPDFSVRALTDVQYLCITKNMYIAALRTTKMLRRGGNFVVADIFEAEYQKVRESSTDWKRLSLSEPKHRPSLRPKPSAV